MTPIKPSEAAQEIRELLQSTPDAGPESLYTQMPQELRAWLDAQCSAPAPAEGEREQFEYDHRDRWLLWYADGDMKPVEHFSGCGAEEAAHARFKQASSQWTCILFRSIELSGYGQALRRSGASERPDRWPMDQECAFHGCQYAGGKATLGASGTADEGRDAAKWRAYCAVKGSPEAVAHDEALHIRLEANERDARRWREIERNPFAAVDKILAAVDSHQPSAVWAGQARAAIDAALEGKT